MPKKIKNEMQGRVAQAAAEALEVVMDQYRQIQKSPENENEMIKTFKLRQDAGRAALAHISMLLKICKDTEEKGLGDDDLADLIRAAEKEIADSQ